MKKRKVRSDFVNYEHEYGLTEKRRKRFKSAPSHFTSDYNYRVIAREIAARSGFDCNPLVKEFERQCGMGFGETTSIGHIMTLLEEAPSWNFHSANAISRLAQDGCIGELATLASCGFIEPRRHGDPDGTIGQAFNVVYRKLLLIARFHRDNHACLFQRLPKDIFVVIYSLLCVQSVKHRNK